MIIRKNKKILSLFLIILLLSAILGCTSETPKELEIEQPREKEIEQLKNNESEQEQIIYEQSSTVFYEIFIRSFQDSSGDGIGDINGIIEKLDYLNDGDSNTDTDLGVEGIWLMPFNPSPSYHGYDVTDYYDINSDYGTLDDFRRLIVEANKRGIKILMDLVVNHSSSKHPWFIESAKGKENEYRDWYVWAEDGDNVSQLGAVGGKAWHARNGGHYLGIFWDGMPDLNFDNPEVRNEMIKIGQFWLEQGVHGFRLDAAKHIFDDFHSTQVKPEIVNKNIEWWNEFRLGMDQINPDAFIIGEVWDNSPVIISPYLEPFNSAFNFGVASELVKSARSESASNIAFRLSRIYSLYQEASKESFVDAPFLTNHDQDRVMSVLKGNIDHAKMAAAQLLTLPGTPFIYYGEEIGMEGMKPDEQIREPMLWYADGEQGAGQTTWQRAKYNLNNPPSVEKQLNDPDSLLSHYKQLIQWRKQEKALSNGGIKDYVVTNKKVLTYVRMTNEERILVVHNLSGESQSIDLNKEDEQRFEDVILFNKDTFEWNGSRLTLAPYSTVIMK
jgi:alpha-amylase